MKWIGSFSIKQVLSKSIDSSFVKPPESGSVYLVSAKSWQGMPDVNSFPLYVGSNTGKSNRFRTRVGDLLADMFGFFGTETNHHTGGQSLYNYCVEQRINPLSLHIGWLKTCPCQRCAEIELFSQLHPILNKNRPSRCTVHDVSIRKDKKSVKR